MENLIKNNEALLTEITKKTRLINKNLALIAEKLYYSNYDEKIFKKDLEKFKTHIENYNQLLDTMETYKKLNKIYIDLLTQIK